MLWTSLGGNHADQHTNAGGLLSFTRPPVMKLAIILGAAGAGAESLVAPDGVFGTIIIIGAVVGALAMIWAKAVHPSIRFGRRLARLVGKLEQLPDWQQDLAEWRDGVERRLDTLEGTGTPKGTTPGRGMAHPNEA